MSIKELPGYNKLFFELVQVSLGTRSHLSHPPSNDEWKLLYHFCTKQAIVSFVLSGIEQLSTEGIKPPFDLLMAWIAVSEQVATQNKLMNNEVKRITERFKNEGHQTAILKGQANARLYPNPLRRQSGDIDIWVDGGRSKVIDIVRGWGLLDEVTEYAPEDSAITNDYHIHLPANDNGIIVEVHYKPSSGNHNPFTDRRLQNYLTNEIKNNSNYVEEGFYVPSIKFALVMQLSHIQSHFFHEGVGMRQLIDYFYLLKALSEQEKQEMEGILKKVGLMNIAGAVMWVLETILGMKRDYLIAPSDEKRGLVLLANVMEGGNFGFYRPDAQKRLNLLGLVSRQFDKFKLFSFAPQEMTWKEIKFVMFFIKSLPERIKRRSWSLGARS